MITTSQHSLRNAIEYIQQRDLGKAIKVVNEVISTYPYLADIDELQNILQSYRLMLDFMKRGYKDDSRDELYNSLLRKMFRLVSNMENVWNIKNVSPYIEAKSIAGNINTSYDFIRNVLENFVTDTTIVSLEDISAREQKSKELYARHQDFINRLFNAVWVSGQWKESDCDFYTKLLLSPTIDTNDAQLLISAIIIGTINQFDFYKFLTLINVYKESSDEKIRQRALVGFSFSLPETDISELYPELSDVFEELLRHKEIRRELLDLQIQVFYCMNAEKDNSHIQKDIMPNLINNSNLQITRFGIIEKEEDGLQDILHPDKADKAMEDVEQSIQKMINMQKAGSDIYFGGFSQMKRFPFFSSMSNWLCPFYAEHPALHTVNTKLDDNKFIDILFKSGPFCDSDKYSFALAISSIIDKIPANMREMMNNAESMGPTVPVEEMQTAAYIRRMYLQDLYRFYKLYPYRSGLVNPFGQVFTMSELTPRKSFFFISSLLKHDLLAENKLRLGKFLMKQQRWTEINDLILSFDNNIPADNAEFYLLYAYADMNDNLYGTSIRMFRKALEIEPENVMALKGIARAYMAEEEYEQAEMAYKKLIELFPANKNFIINRCITLLKLNRTTEAMETLYRIDYENPDDMNIKRVLAWGLLQQNKPETAKKEYDKIISDKSHKKEDCLNAGYCMWFIGDIAEAIALFKSYVAKNEEEENNVSLKSVFLEDYDMIHKYRISDTEIQLIIDLVEE